MHTSHLASLGAREIPRRQFSVILEELVDYPLIPELWTKHSREHQPGPRPDVETQ
jgi:Leu/Phe-tRNA-protein transferase